LLLGVFQLNAQSLKNVFSRTISKSNDNTTAASLNGDEIGNALKEALQKGVERGTAQLSATDGFFKNAAVKILLPPEAQKAGDK
ncbi:DUF4197 family protein, partial [Klebsiella pneumoniae]|uniref:DUF4197 family protein n=1 Tax=Klebsiella pneumoniae TaxID=573 RepID=UPI003009B271